MLKTPAPKTQHGFSTVEILIAFAVLSFSLVAIISMVFGGQSLALDARTDDEAAHKAQDLLEATRASSTLDFALVQPIAPVADVDTTYTKSLDVNMIDSWTKKVTSNVSWNAEGGRISTVTLTTLLTDPSGFINNNTCGAVLSNPVGWKNPQHYEKISTDIVNQAAGNNSNGLGIADMAVLNQRLYIAAHTSANNDANFYITDLPANSADWPTHQGYRGSMDTNQNGAGGLAAITAATINNTPYVFIANTNIISTNGHLQVVDVSNPIPTGWNPPIARYRLPAISTTKFGRSIFYHDGYIYLGLVGNASGGAEFNIIDVRNPLNPSRVGGYATGGHTVNSVFVKDNYAYITTANNADPNSRIMSIIDVNINSPTFAQRVSG